MSRLSIVATPVLVLTLVAGTPAAAEAQGRGGGSRPAAAPTIEVTLSVGVQTQIRDFYSERPSGDAEALPPGIRRNLERGKRLPPGIAKKVAPAELRNELRLPQGYDLVEVGLDVFLVEVATQVIHDVLMDVVR